MKYVLSLLFIALINLSSRAQQTLVVSEVMFKPLTNETVNEFVELFNTSQTDSVDLSTLSLKDNLSTSNLIFQSGTKKVGPRSFALIMDATYFEAASSALRDYEGLIPNNTPVYKTSNSAIGNALGNSTDSVFIYSQPNGTGALISKVKWTASSTAAGISIEKINPDLSINDVYPSSNMTLSFNSKGTPGFLNSVSAKDFDAELTSSQIITVNPTILDSVAVKSVITNKGTQSLNNITYRIYADTSINQNYETNEKFYETQISLASGEFTEFVEKIKPDKFGTYSIFASVTIDNDENTANNSKSVSVTVSDVTLYDAGVSDLTIQSKTHYYKNDSVLASISVNNYGLKTAKNVTLIIKENSSVIKSWFADSISVAESVTFDFYWKLTTTGQRILTAKVTAEGDSNPVNDSLQKTITVETQNYHSELSLSEIMYNPTGAEGSNQNEFVELFNTSFSDSVDLTGLYIKDASTVSALVSHSGGLLLAPRKYAVIHPPTYYSQSVRLYDGIEDTVNTIRLKTMTSSIGNGLTSTNDAVYLFSAAGDTIDSYSWTTDSGDGFSVEKKDMEIRKNILNWALSTTKNGSPGNVNSVNIYLLDGKLTTQLTIAVFPENAVSVPYTLTNPGKQTISQARLVVYEDQDYNSIPDNTDSIGSVILTNLNLNSGASVAGEILVTKTFTFETQFLIYLRITGDEFLLNNNSKTQLMMRQTTSSVLISEVMFDPINSSTDFLDNQPEYIELFNPTGRKILLKDWVISDQINEQGQSNLITVTDSLYIYPKSYAIISSDSALLTFWNYFDASDTTATFTIVNKSSLNLNGDADAVIVYDSFHTTIDSLSYLSSWHNSSYSTTKGISLERRNYDSPTNDPYNWGSSSNFPGGGTPGKPNSIGITKTVISSSIIFSPNPFSPDGDGFDDVVLINYHLKSEVNFVKVRIFDRLGRLTNELKNYSPAGSVGQLFWDGKNQSGQVVPMGSYIVLIEGFNSENQNLESLKKVVVVAKKL